MIDYKEIGRRIAYFCKKENFTQQNLADEMDLSVSYIGQIERGITHISLERLYEISKILNVDIIFLLSPSLSNNSNMLGIQVSEIVKNWTPQQITFLFHMLAKADEYFKDLDKGKK